jgi:diguanylate cyclase (GGDEF)-like protein
MAQKSSDRGLWHSPVGILAIAATLGTLVYIVWILSGQYNDQIEPLVSSGVLSTLYILSAAVGFRIFLQKYFHSRWRWGWFFISLAMLSTTVGEFLWVYYENVLGIEPFPSLADLFYLLYYPLLLAAVLSFPFTHPKKRESQVLYLDLLIIITACAMTLWYFFLASMQASADSGWVGFMALSYPLGDLLILTGVIALIQRDAEKAARAPLFFLAIGMALSALGDLFFAFYETNGIEYSMAPLNVLWAGSGLYIFLAAAWQYRTSLKDLPHIAFIDRTQRLLRLTLPYIAAAIGPILLVVSIYNATTFDQRLRGLLLGTLILVALVMVRQYVVLVENVEISRELQRLATTDSLTNLYNRHFFNETFHREIGRAGRYEKPLSVLLMDVDNFKHFNDTCGHLQGDMVLKIIADTLSANLRKSDFLARFGGDEFVVVLPETDLQGAEAVAAKMRKAVGDQMFSDQPLSISIGAATYRPGISGEQILEEADAALYRLKASQVPKTQSEADSGSLASQEAPA